MPQIDALRFIAAFGVINFHWAARLKLDVDMSFGPYRVPLLLVLSGFLITSILLKIKDRSDNKVSALKTFFTKRALRILPVYYLFLLLVWCMQDTGLMRHLPYFVSLTSNLASFSGLQVYTSSTTHLWNISVLEQFYFCFPWVIVLIGKNQEIRLALLMILAGTIIRTYGFATGIQNLNLLPFTNFDYLGGGILLAVLIRRKENSLHQWLHQTATVMTLLFLLLAYLFFQFSKGWASSFGYNLATLLFCCCLIYKASVGFTGVIGRVLEFQPLVFLGRISYGLYIYHMASPFFLRRILLKLQIGLDYGYTLYVVNLVFLLLLCIASWYLFEKPITQIRNLRWKGFALAPVTRIGRLLKA